MSCYQFSRHELLQKVKKNYSKEKLQSIIYWKKKVFKKGDKNMTDKKKSSKKIISKNYFKKLKAYEDEILLEKAKRPKKVANYYKKKRNKCKSMSKIKIKKIYKQFKWL